MRALFPPWTNSIARASVLVIPLAGLGALCAPMLFVRTPYFTEQDNPVQQPVEFDHRHHVADEGIDCRFCHASVETAASAGYPPTSTCMGCHAQVWNASPILEVVRRAYFSDTPVAWKRVHRLPDFVYFDHSIHVAKGVGCETCHGRVDQMAAVEQIAPLTMEWCLDCHRNPQGRIRPRERVVDMGWPSAGADEEKALIARYDVHTRTSCTACHR